MRQAQAIEPRFLVESGGFHLESIADPLSDGVAIPGWIHRWRMLAAIGKNLPEIHPRFIKNQSEPGHLNDFEWRGRKHRARNAIWKTVLRRPAASVARRTFLEDRRRRGQQRDFCILWHEPAQAKSKLIAILRGALAFSADPEAREIRFAIGCAGRL